MRYGEDDELSIALLAFVEAIRSYNSEKGNFLPFAQNVIKRRLIDYFRKENRQGTVISLNEYYNEDDDEKDLSIEASVNKHLDTELGEYRRLELEQLKTELAQWGISFFDLVQISPKHDKNRKMCRQIIEFIISEPGLVKFIKEKRYLPIADIDKPLKIPRKKIERLRKYIIAVVIIKSGDYQYINDYVRWE